jgi:hypothetical protein
MMEELIIGFDDLELKTQSLKKKSVLFPDVYLEEDGGVVWATTIANFEHKGITYKRYHFKNYVPSESVIGNFKAYKQKVKELVQEISKQAEETIKNGSPLSGDVVV